MQLPLRIAQRYLFARKSTNAINIITGITVTGLAIGTAALLLVLSVFNGFEVLLTSLFGNFNPEIKITPLKGKTFEEDSLLIAQLQALPEVALVARSLEEVAFFEYKDNQHFGILKGVDQYYHQVTHIDSTVIEGHYVLERDGRPYLVLGAGMRNKLGVNIDDYLEPVVVYMAKRKLRSTLEQPFRKRYAYAAGTFKIQQEYDQQYVLAPLWFAQELMQLDGQLTALEIRLMPDADMASAITAIQKAVGPHFAVKDRYQQEEAFFKLMNIEKWLSYAILTLVLILVAFNMVGSLWMIVLEKKKDIAILRAMGATSQLIRQVFLVEGLLISTLGLVMGFILATIFYLLQKQYGLIGIPEGFVVQAYPVQMRWPDFFVVAFTVLLIGLAASVLPAQKAQSLPALIREE